MARSLILQVLIQFIAFRSVLSAPPSIGLEDGTLLQPSFRNGASDVAGANDPDHASLVFRPEAPGYFAANEQAPIVQIPFANGKPIIPKYVVPANPRNDNNYAYAWQVQNSTDPPPQVFNRYDLSRNLFHDAFDVITKVPANTDPRVPFPGGHYSGVKYPDTLPGKIEMYLDQNTIGYQMTYQDITFMLKVLFDAEVAKPDKGLLGYFDFQFWGFLNGSQEPHKIVHGYFKSA